MSLEELEKEAIESLLKSMQATRYRTPIGTEVYRANPSEIKRILDQLQSQREEESISPAGMYFGYTDKRL